MDAAAVAFRFALAALFAVAGASKLRRRREFEQMVRNYDVVPAAWARVIAVALPPIEVTVAVLLAVGLALRVVSFVVAAMLAAFIVAVAINLVRGRDIDCGCFGTVAQRRITWVTVLRNAALLAMAALLSYRAPTALALDDLIAANRLDGVSHDEAVALLFASTLALAGVALATAARRARSAALLQAEPPKAR